MNKKSAILDLHRAITEIFLPKINTYIQDRKNDISIQALIEKEITHIEELEDMINNLTSNVTFAKGDSMAIDGYNFRYNESTEYFNFFLNSEASATAKIYTIEGLNYEWSIRNSINIRIKAILVTLDETLSFDEIVKIIETQIDFNEFINMHKNKN